MLYLSLNGVMIYIYRVHFIIYMNMSHTKVVLRMHYIIYVAEVEVEVESYKNRQTYYTLILFKSLEHSSINPQIKLCDKKTSPQYQRRLFQSEVTRKIRSLINTPN
ncbi:predicted protein [Sclerotinia sclerotiorum 1980 UF-70]|uniref:Uncharacterized protein n=1 Tax=Sclerotinia sclerotiorum (strain ATCC 18683 / 1980 / Ss-1) TaxID=665079 RepID=A7E4K3_SCLS1|nr:predicted protein [Sclerotinia sclerotiorum 1980 UF-70]EDN90825.1 predicted protein [Sclerotinia sclerotiorum 1980 UF-70]